MCQSINSTKSPSVAGPSIRRSPSSESSPTISAPPAKSAARATTLKISAHSIENRRDATTGSVKALADGLRADPSRGGLFARVFDAVLEDGGGGAAAEEDVADRPHDA